ncbi:MAG: hypothetical protein AABZ30_00245 [Myxococcota bacterium]
MARKKQTNGGVVDLTVEILRDIRAEIRESNQRLGRVEHGLTEIRSRFDHLLGFVGDRYRDHEKRLRSLEQRVSR